MPLRLRADNPSLDIGCHLVLVQGRSVLHPARDLPATLQDLLRAPPARNTALRRDCRAGARNSAAGIRPSHIDTHKHTHLLPPVLEAVARVAREFDIPWVRRPFDFGIDGSARFTKRTVGFGMRIMRPRFASALKGLRTTDHFAGFQITGSLNENSLAQVLERLPVGLTEFMCHPGLLGPELRAAATRLKESRETELAALLSPETRAVIERRGIQLLNYRQA